MSKPPAFQLFASDFYMDTNEWEDYEVGIYTRLLLSQWVNGSLPSEPKKLQRIAGTTQKRIQKALPTLKMKFKVDDAGRLYNSRMEEVREMQRKYKESQSERAKKRWNNRDAKACATALPTHVPKGCSSSSSSKEKKYNKEKNVFGEFQNVLLTEGEYQKLKISFGEQGTKDRIENLSSGIASKGYKYKSHYATILSWERKNKAKNGKSKSW